MSPVSFLSPPLKHKNTKNMSAPKLRVGYVGLGLMGHGIAKNILVKGQFPLTVWNRTASKAAELVSLGATLAASPKDVADKCDVIFTNLSDSPDVEDVILREGDGILVGCKQGSIIVDNSTIKPKVAQFIFAECLKKGVSFLDVPLSGGALGARAGTCTAMVGGDENALEKVTDILKAYCKAVTHIGPSGAGQIAKCANQIMVAAQMTAEAELLVFAQKAGADPQKVVAAIKGGAAACWTLDNKPQRIFSGDRSAQFKIDHQLKDLKIVMETAGECKICLPVTSANTQLFQSSAAIGHGELDNSAVLGVLEQLNAVCVGPEKKE